VFLLNFVSDPELRRTITAATNTSEAWNAFIQWVAFGGDGIIRENSRDEQRKIIRYNHLVANLLVFHNAVSMMRALQELIDEGHPVTEEIIARLAPYRTDHINRFGAPGDARGESSHEGTLLGVNRVARGTGTLIRGRRVSEAPSTMWLRSGLPL
jgi:Tn3 transposase DDE domain